MKSLKTIILIMCLLAPSNKSHSQETSTNILYFTKHYSAGNYSLAAKKGAEILRYDSIRPQDDERFRLLYKTIRSFLYARQLDKAYAFITTLNAPADDPLLADYIKLYQGIMALTCNRTQQAKVLLNQLLIHPNNGFLVDSVRAKIYHNLSIIYGQEEQHAQRLNYLAKSFELEKKNLLNNQNYESYNVSVEVYTATLYGKYRQYEKAYRVLQEALIQPFNQHINNYNHALYQNYIDLLLRMGLQDKAKHEIIALTKFYENHELQFKEEYANFLISLANHYKRQNNYTNCILYATRTLSITSLNNYSKPTRSSAHMLLATTYFDLQQYDKMKYYLLKEVAESKQGNLRNLADAYLSTAEYLAKLYEDETAYAYIDSAQQVYYHQLKLPLSKNFENILALAYYELGQYNQCLFHLNNVGQILSENKNYTHYLFWDNKYEKALCFNRLDKYHQSYRLLTQVIDEMLTKYPHLQDPASSIQDSRFAMLYRKVNIELAHGLNRQYRASNELTHLKEAMTYIEAAGRGLERLRSKQYYDRDRLVTGKLYDDFTRNSASIAMALHKATNDQQYLHQAFNFIQKGKSYALLQGVADKQYKLNSGVPIDMINALNKNKEQYDRYLMRYNDALFTHSSDSTLLAQLNKQMDRCMSNIDSINMLIKIDFPLYEQEKAQRPYLSIAETQQRLQANQCIIDYYETETEIFRFTINTDTFHCAIIPKDAAFKQSFQRVIEELSNPFVGQGTSEKMQRFAGAAHLLYKRLLGDVQSLINDKELIIVPHSELSYLAFEALLTKDYSHKKPNFKDYPWLIKQQAISYSYNTALLNNVSSQARIFQKVIAFAPHYSGHTNPQNINLETMRQLDSLLPSLPGAQKELSAIESSFSVIAFEGEEATRPRFIASMQSDAILHLAMHSINNEAQPFNSQLIFSSHKGQSGGFKAGELYNYNIKSPLAVLSSCSSGSGYKHKGEGLLSLARAFTFAGVEAQVMTLWPVNDQSGANLIKHFYAKLKDGLNKNSAMRESKLNYLAAADGIRSHPYYWASYVLSGNTNAIEQKMPKGKRITLLALALLSGMLVFYYIRRR
ncbi:CHAT domain-containing protein [Carboxylicivirga sp. N1E11]|uniref:CHAT domain-containing protein n=2 Tax=Carboxylicivirga TaxID=1628153 RepID=UPI003D3307DD